MKPSADATSCCMVETVVQVVVVVVVVVTPDAVVRTLTSVLSDVFGVLTTAP
eukprot:CAMPEP_0173444224 /NCGR_PEP_ID=MMETSP1357-20121228/31749_1 /TAXON_ID=77926 /ORGANISM="Hemiselmis rufescens, Strain PCC563" /LENGTH=51 /DNA_ID=CAMNT_0014410247 /DNA_START=38 /DNA_END=189 /DNA_ORIENTATION=-